MQRWFELDKRVDKGLVIKDLSLSQCGGKTQTGWLDWMAED